MTYNQYGSIAGRRAEQITVTLDASKLPIPPKTTLLVDQQLALPKGDTTLFCAVWDPGTRRLRTLQIPLAVKSR